jgi:hypothetical protein
MGCLITNKAELYSWSAIWSGLKVNYPAKGGTLGVKDARIRGFE